MRLPKFLRRYGGDAPDTESKIYGLLKTPYTPDNIPDMNRITLENIPTIIDRGAQRAKAKILITRTPEQVRSEYSDVLKEHKELILYAMEMGFLEMYALKPDVDPDSVYEFALVDGKHLLITKHPNLKPGEVVAWKSKRVGRKYREHHHKMIENHSVKLTVSELF